jgi:hypothetical protein
MKRKKLLRKGAAPISARIALLAICALHLITLFSLSIDMLVFLCLNAVAGFTILISWIVFLSKKAPLKSKIIVSLIIVSGCFAYVAGYQYMLTARYYVFLYPKVSELEKFTKDIISYKKIFKMSSGERYYKQLNDHLIEYDRSIVEYDRNTIDKSSPLRRREYYLDVLDNEDISLEKYDYFRQRLNILGFIDFELDESFVSFTIDGMLDNCYGIAYSVNGNDPGGLDCGRVVVWKKIRGNWYRWGTS